MAALRPSGYTLSQIVLHWVIAVLVLFQLVFGDDMKPGYRAYSRGAVPDPEDVLASNLHVAVGALIFLLALVRVALRLRYGAPPPPADDPAWQRAAASLSHLALYGVIILMPLTGAAAWFLGMGGAGDLHEDARPFIIALIALHAGAALFEHFIKRTDVLRRMLRPAG